ncbi:OB-fold nucleic acid binding domain-containing protein [Streptomyces mirabilis]|uniref:OB-fold nucleic acid binding domain-containing protein n=1 Tax=Streptomyces mirabilis TaxID=68239 RepID=UPI0031BB445B
MNAVPLALVSSPTGDVDDEAIVPCTAKDPHIAHALLNKIRPGDLVRVSGLFALPGSADGGLQLCVDALEVLSTVPPGHFERMGPYLIVFDPDTDGVPVFTESGTRVDDADDADDADDISGVSDRFEHEQEAS